MSDDGSTKDDVKVPDGEVGDKINKLFTEDGKDTSELSWNTISEALLTNCRRHCPHCYG
jgi:translation initiation factor 5A